MTGSCNKIICKVPSNLNHPVIPQPKVVLNPRHRGLCFAPTPRVCSPQNLWFANPGGSNSMPSRSHSSVQRTRSLPVHTSPQTMLMFQQPGRQQRGFSTYHSQVR